MEAARQGAREYLAAKCEWEKNDSSWTSNLSGRELRTIVLDKSQTIILQLLGLYELQPSQVTTVISLTSIPRVHYSQRSATSG